MEDQLRQIKMQIMQLQDGVRMQSMKDKGADYERSYGVSIQHLKLVAERHESSNQLCNALWDLNWRESKLMCVFLQDPKELDADTCLNWVNGLHTLELIEQFSYYLMPYIPETSFLFSRWLKDEGVNTSIVSYRAMAVQLKKGLTEDLAPMELALNMSEANLTNGNRMLKDSVAFFLRELASKKFLPKELASLKELLQKSDDLYMNQLAEDIEFLSERN